ncbi:hypothetical protein [Actinoplanes couchii]|uniref:Proteinase inhibitor I4 serpin n=1 Tax=Actinoplanes couchii TaxID=403638 RepID=A0ABQ3XDL8_9ACTN|nr:hypothetical protein [Actinoplanes couchii]MDR6317071.1 hypothetical protein [Actinoplanes couchii]GID56566.1 hypothetical protein Aco03nite_049700 [Actinoplanes couchii]
MDEKWIPALARYAARLHGVAGDEHHVASPLGAWLLLALTAAATAPAQPDADPAVAELAAVLGVEPGVAAEVAAGLLADPHPLVAVATAMWHAAGVDPEHRYAGLPEQTERGVIPDAAGLDRWARERTGGLIEKFPGDPAGVPVMLASALAARVRWEVPFEVTAASALGADSPWASRLTHVLRKPVRGHEAFVAGTDQAGDVIAHRAVATTEASDTRVALRVVSVAASRDVPPEDVLAAAYEIACDDRDRRRKPLADLPLGESPLWTIREWAGSSEWCDAVLPCWSAASEHDLTGPGLGFGPAARALLAGTEMGGDAVEFGAVQSAMARFGRNGFDVASLTGLTVGGAAPEEPSRSRIAELRFAHPYAVVAVATQQRWDDRRLIDGPWHGVPVFSAWVGEPEDVPVEDRDPDEWDD